MCFCQSFSNPMSDLVYNNISRVLPTIMKKLTWLVFAVCLLPMLSFCSLFDLSSFRSRPYPSRCSSQQQSSLVRGYIHLFFFFFRSNNLAIFLEWSLATEFSATDEFLKKWADAQKFSYGKGAGWFVSHLFLSFCFLPSIKKKVSLTN